MRLELAAARSLNSSGGAGFICRKLKRIGEASKKLMFCQSDLVLRKIDVDEVRTMDTRILETVHGTALLTLKPRASY